MARRRPESHRLQWLRPPETPHLERPGHFGPWSQGFWITWLTPQPSRVPVALGQPSSQDRQAEMQLDSTQRDQHHVWPPFMPQPWDQVSCEQVHTDAGRSKAQANEGFAQKSWGRCPVLQF